MNPRFALPLAAPPVLALLIAAACSGTHVYLGGGQSAGASNAGGSSSLALGGMAADVGGSGAGAGAPNGLLVDPDPNTVNIEVTSSHLGLGIDPDVWCIVASTLGARRA